MTARDQLLSIWDLMALVRRRWILAGAIMAAAVAAGLLFAILATPRYSSASVLSVREEELGGSGLSALAGQLGSVANLAGLSMKAGANENQAVAVLESWDLMQAFIERHQLIDELSADASSSGKQLSMQRAVRHFKRKILAVRRDKTAGVLIVSIVWSEPGRASEWVNTYVRMADDLMRARAMQDAKRSLEFLQAELESTREVAIREAVANLVEAEMKRHMFAQARAEFALQVLDRAHASDPRDSVYPRRAWVLVAALMLGGMLALLIILLLARREQNAART
jgi:uncharacterized protein involved in exopolysaccharide biosynthesis